ncbi:MAG: IPT/TIG domain-containing protein, partial [Actinomycetota bacterium]|nr:IPT/TIG domain-containing protein [Actinomycetota bacterium]
QARFAVVTENIIFAQVPPGPNNTFATVTLRDAAGSDSNPAFYYTDATASAEPNTGLTNGASLNFKVNGYRPNTGAAVAESSPVVAYAWPRPTMLPPPYVDPLGVFSTDASGNFTGAVNVLAEPDFNIDGDRTAACPPTQEQANLGLTDCALAWSDFGQAVIAAPIRFQGNPTPQAPTLALSLSTARPGDTVTVGGANWSANPNFGSSTSEQRPGETPLTVEICGIAGDPSRCSPTTGTGGVRYVRYDLAQANGHNGTLSGSTLEGSIYIDENLNQGCSNCFVRVRQHRFNNPAQFIEATAPLSVQPGEAPSSTTTTVPSTTVPTTTTVPPTTTTTVPGKTKITPGGLVPDFGPPAGGTPVRIYGSGFEGNGPVTVTFASSGEPPKPASKVTVVDDTLITAETPPGAGWGKVTVTTEEGGTAELGGEVVEGFFYGDPKVTVTPGAGLNPGQEVGVSWSGIPFVAITIIEQASPLAFVAEPRPNPGALEQVQLLNCLQQEPGPQRNACLLFSAETKARAELANPFRPVDTTASCPPTQEQANAGLVNCSVLVRRSAPQFPDPSSPQSSPPPPPKRTPNVPAPITFAGQTEPEEPTLELMYDPDGNLFFGGRNWSASPEFGSSTSLDGRAGASLLKIEICASEDDASCTPIEGIGEIGEVPLTRYKYDYECKTGALQGGFLVGGIPAVDDLEEGFVRVSQQRSGNPNDFVSATAPMSQATRITSSTFPIAEAVETPEECPGAGRVFTPTTLPLPRIVRATPPATAPAVTAPPTAVPPQPQRTTTVTTPAPAVANLVASPSPPEPPSRGLHSLFGPRSPGGSPWTAELVALGVLALVIGLILAGRRLIRAARARL